MKPEAALQMTVTVKYWRPLFRPKTLWRLYRKRRREGKARLIAVSGAWVLASMRVESE